MELGGSRAAGLTAGRLAATILLCTHNDEASIAAAVETALTQSYSPDRCRLLVVDDGSHDGTPRVLARYARDPRMEVVRQEPNQGLVAACNAGLARIRTPYFLRLDGDDSLAPGAVEALLNCAEESGAQLVYSDRTELGPKENVVRRDLAGELQVPDLIAAGVLLPTQLVREVGGYRTLFWEEYDLFLRLLESGRCTTAHVSEPLYRYYIGRPSAMTTDSDALRRGWAELRELWPPETLARWGLHSYEAGVPGR